MPPCEFAQSHRTKNQQPPASSNDDKQRVQRTLHFNSSRRASSTVLNRGQPKKEGANWPLTIEVSID